MAQCTLQKSIKRDICDYSLAGIKAIYLLNTGLDPKIIVDKDQKVTEVIGDVFEVKFIENTASYSDELAVNGNGGKYRTHTLNFSLDAVVYEDLNAGDALSLGTFTAIVVDKSGKAVVLGRNNGMNATAFNYASGAADADASGWTVTMAGAEKEIAPSMDTKDIPAPKDKEAAAPKASK